ncbi:hypothetical protein DL98DRAFT_636179 [Cadophora sp. DSE1049]|nr:hypothetical protein DL98DRAFT_636179 [Cadophora sp. DSE1049]
MAAPYPQPGASLPLLEPEALGIMFSINDKVYGDTSVSPTETSGFSSTWASLKIYFAEPQLRSRFRIDLKAARKTGPTSRSVNSTGSPFHETQIEFYCSRMKNLFDVELATGSPLPPVFNIPHFRTAADNPSRLVQFECDRFVITRPEVPALANENLESATRDLLSDLANLPSGQTSVTVMIALPLLPVKMDAILEMMRLAMRRDAVADPLRRWVKDWAGKELLLLNNVHQVDTRPDPAYSVEARAVFPDALEYKVTLGYNRVCQFECDTDRINTYMSDVVSIKIVDIPSASARVGTHDTSAAKLYLGYVSFSTHMRARLSEGQYLKIRLPVDVPPCEPYEREILTVRQYIASEKRKMMEALLQEQQEARKHGSQGKHFAAVPLLRGYDEDVDRDDESLHWWNAYGDGVVDFRHDALKSDRPHVKTDVKAMPADYDNAISFKAALKKHEAIKVKVTIQCSNQILLKDELRGVETVLSGFCCRFQVPQSDLQAHLGQFLRSVDQTLPYPEQDFSEHFGGLEAIRLFSDKIDLTEYQLSVILKLLKCKHGLTILKGCFGSDKSNYGLFFGCLLLASNTKLFHAPSTGSEGDSTLGTTDAATAAARTSEKLLWTTTTNIATDRAAQLFAGMLEAAGVPAKILRCHNIEAEKSCLIDKYIPRRQFEPLPKSEQHKASFLARQVLHDKAAKHIQSRKKGDPRRRVQNIKLSDAMARELEENLDIDEYLNLKIMFQIAEYDGEEADIDIPEMHRLVGVLMRNTLKRMDGVFCTNAAAIRLTLASSFKATFGVIDEAARALEISTVAVFGSHPHVRRWLLICDPNQMHPHQSQMSEGKQSDDPFFQQGAISLPQRLGNVGFTPLYLMKQFRCYGMLSRFPSEHYYNGMVEDGNAGKAPDELKFVRTFFKKQFRVDDNVVFIDARGARSRRQEHGTSSYNKDYVEKVREILLLLLAELDRCDASWASKFTIGITSHYTAQLQLYQKLIDNIGDSRLSTLPSDFAHGQQKHLMIRDWCHTRVITSHNGDAHRTLTTCTRAVFGQIDIGSSAVWNPSNYSQLSDKGFEFDESTKHAFAYWKFCEENNAIFVSKVSR